MRAFAADAASPQPRLRAARTGEADPFVPARRSARKKLSQPLTSGDDGSIMHVNGWGAVSGCTPVRRVPVARWIEKSKIFSGRSVLFLDAHFPACTIPRSRLWTVGAEVVRSVVELKCFLKSEQCCRHEGVARRLPVASQPALRDKDPGGRLFCDRRLPLSVLVTLSFQ